MMKRRLIYLRYGLFGKLTPNQDEVSKLLLSIKQLNVDYLSFEVDADSNSRASVSLKKIKVLIRANVFCLLKKPSFLYIQGASNCSYIFPYFLFIKFFKLNCKIIYHTQDIIDPRKISIHFYCEKLISKYCSLVILNSEERAHLFRMIHRLKVLPMVLPTVLLNDYKLISSFAKDKLRNLISCKYGIKPDNLLLFALGGRISSERAFDDLKKLICASKYYDRIVLLSTGNDGNKFVEFTFNDDLRIVKIGKLKFSSLIKAYSLCDVGFLFYNFDSIGNYFQEPGRFSEYLVSDISILSRKCISMLCRVDYNNVGVSVEPGNTHEFDEAIKKCLRNPSYDIRRAVLENKRNEYRNQFRKIERFLLEGVLP